MEYPCLACHGYLFDSPSGIYFGSWWPFPVTHVRRTHCPVLGTDSISFILPVRLKVGEDCWGHAKVVQRAALAVLTTPSRSPHRYGRFEIHVEPVHLQGAEKHCSLYYWLMFV